MYKFKIIIFNIILLYMTIFIFSTNTNAKSYVFDESGMELVVSDEEDLDDETDDIKLKIEVKNKNPYAVGKFNLAFNNNNDFTISGTKVYNFDLEPKGNIEIIKKYYNNNSLYVNIDDIMKKKKIIRPFNTFPEDISEINKIYDDFVNISTVNISSESFIDAYENYLSYKKSNNSLKNQKISKWLILLIVILVAIFIIIGIILVYKLYSKNFFIILIFGILSISLHKNIAKDFLIDSFAFNKEYSKNYKVEMSINNMPYTFSFDLKWVYEGDNAYEESDMDSDGDKVLDKNEVIFMTDVHNADTDGDSLSDYVEIYLINTSPIRIDSDNNGISDYDEDFDGDYLSNGEEVRYGTMLIEVDSDYDGLSDYEEVKLYNTNPLVTDTDGDGLSDYEEVKLNLNPLNKYTDGSTLDYDVKKYQVISREVYDNSLLTDNIIDVTIKGNVRGIIDNHIKVKESNNDIVKNLNFILGKPIKIESDYSDKFILQFDCKDYEKLSDGLRICTIENGKIKILNTDIDGFSISASVGSGDYFLMDLISFSDNLISYIKEEHK